jgi:pyrimidine-specific ribonucleoside hydrolase
MRFQRLAPRAILVVVALLFVLGCSARTGTSASTLPTPATNRPLAIVIDTDMAADDWMAILYLLQRPDVTLKAITVTGAGEAHCVPGVQHALGLVALSSHDDIPVACGREKPLRGDHAFPDSWREGVDSLFGLTLTQSEGAASDLTAVELLDLIIHSSDEKVTLLSLGPLTNIAEGLQNNPSLVDNLERIYIMGGAVNVPGNVGNSGVQIENDTAEWNIYVDPRAANLVLQSGAPVTLVPLDATNHVLLTNKFYKRLARNRPTPEAKFVFDVLTMLKDLIDSGGYYFWDPLAAAILTDESLAAFEGKNLCVIEAEGSESGRTKVGEECPEVRVAISANAGRFEQLLLDTLNTTSD